MRQLITLLSAIMFASQLYAQPGMTATIQNMHLWRGGEVADGVVITGDVHYLLANKSIEIGFWGGTNVAGEYKEFNNYINFTKRQFSLTIADTYNFSEYATYNNEEFFNYITSSTGRFVDITMSYKLSDELPITLTWATVVFGRDRDAQNLYNRYSTFCNVAYQLYNRDRWTIDANVGSAFALNNVDNSANFYGDKAGIVEVAITTKYTIPINDKRNIPLSARAMWNPQNNKGYLELCAQVITF